MGTRYECDTKVGPLQLTDVMEITEWTPGKAMGVRHVGLVTGTGPLHAQASREADAPGSRWDERLRFPLLAGRPDHGATSPNRCFKRIWRRNLRHLAQRF